MPYITSVERLGIEKGRREGCQEGCQEGLLEGIALGLKLRFSAAELALLPEIRTIQDVAILEAILRGLEKADKVEALRRIIISGLITQEEPGLRFASSGPPRLL